MWLDAPQTKILAPSYFNVARRSVVGSSSPAVFQCGPTLRRRKF